MILAIDMGGTTLRLGLFSKNRLVKFVSYDWSPSDNNGGPEVHFMKNRIKEFIKNLPALNITGVGIVTGASLKNGVIRNWPNRPHWSGVSLFSILKKDFKCPILVEDDAKAAAALEAKEGCLRFHKNSMYITVGTGIGAGIIIGGEIYRGATNLAGELGHFKLFRTRKKCSCGFAGCLQAHSSGRTILKRLAKKNHEWDRPLSVTQRRVLKECAFILGETLADISNFLDLSAIAVGGGALSWGAPWWKSLEISFSKSLEYHLSRKTVLLRATYWKNASLRGAASLFSNRRK